jgi:hypothetical protein
MNQISFSTDTVWSDREISFKCFNPQRSALVFVVDLEIRCEHAKSNLFHPVLSPAIQRRKSQGTLATLLKTSVYCIGAFEVHKHNVRRSFRFGQTQLENCELRVKRNERIGFIDVRRRRMEIQKRLLTDDYEIVSRNRELPSSWACVFAEWLSDFIQSCFQMALSVLVRT